MEPVMKCNCPECQAWKARTTVENGAHEVRPGSHGWMRPHQPEYGDNAALKKLPTGLYIGCFHGRKTPDEELADWGAQGPVIGPLEYVHLTYMGDPKFEFASFEDAQRYFHLDNEHNQTEGNFDVVDGMLVVGDGMYYGDWTVFYHVKGREDA